MHDPDHLHHHVLAIAARVSPPLAEAIAVVGPLAIEPPSRTDVAARLCVEVVNQQLSIRAANAIRARIDVAAAGLGLAPRDLFVPEHTDLLRACGLWATRSGRFKPFAQPRPWVTWMTASPR